MTLQRFVLLVFCTVVITLGISACLTADGTAQQDGAEWPQFRGLAAGVVPDDPNLPETWSDTENVVWATDIPGLSWSSPVITGDHVFVTSATSEDGATDGSYDSNDEHRWMLYDLSFQTGQIRWQRELHNAPPPMKRHLKNSFASETPVTDGRRVYVYFGSIGLLAALNMSGETVWRAHVGSFKGRQEFGTAASPVLHGGRLYIVNDNTTSSFLAAFDADTGDEVWRVERDETENWSTPFVWVNEVRTEIVTTGTGGVRSYSLDGDLLWKLHGMSSLVIPTPFAAHDLLFINSGYIADSNRPVYAVRAGASGDITLGEGSTSNDYIVWSHPQLGSYNPSSLVYGDYHYTLLDRGILMCYDARTGQEVYPRQRVTAGTLFTASPWAYNGKIFALSEDGDTYVIRAGSEFEVLGRNSLDEMTLATPAFARGSIFLRTASKLYRISAD